MHKLTTQASWKPIQRHGGDRDMELELKCLYTVDFSRCFIRGNSHEPNRISIGVRFHGSFELPGQR